MILYSPDRWCSPQSLWFCGRGFAKLRLLCGCSHNKTPGACFCLEVWFKSWQQRSPTTPQGDRHRQKWKSSKNLFVFVWNVMKRMTDLRCIKARLRVVCFAGYCSNFVEIKSAARPPMFGFVESLTRSRWYRARGLHLTFPRGDFIYRAAECALVGLTKAGSQTHTTFQVSWRIWLWLTRRLHFKTNWRCTFYAFKVSESTQALRANIEAIWSDGRSNARGGNGQL